MAQVARITGTVEYREGDGATLEIPPGPCEIEVTDLDVTISWADGATKGVASMPVPDYKRYVAEGAIALASG